jgi:hypothetical protein
MKNKYLLIVLSAIIIIIAGSNQRLLAQGATTSWITGKITDSNNGALPGATVQAVHTPTGSKYGVAARLDGRYDIPNMKVGGPYAITVSFVGFKTKSIEGVFLSLGQKQKLNFILVEDAVTIDEVIVTATQGDIGKGRTGAETNIDNAQLVLMPTISRSASDLTRLTPQSDGNSFGGRNDQYNNFSLDGSIFNNPFGLDAATPGGQTNAQPVSLDAIDQIQVSLAPYDVTQAGFTGASINAVTKSGTNNVEGTIFAFSRNDGMTGSKVNDTDIVVPSLSQFQGGFSIGGPIIKNKLFIFANAEIERREDAGSNFVANTGSNSGSNVSRVLATDLNAVSSALRTIGYETGPYEGYTHESNNVKGILKLDWNINDKHSLTATYNFLDAERDLNAHPLAIQRRGPSLTTLQYDNSGYQINNKIQSGIIELKSIFSNTVSNKFQAGFTHFDDFRNSNSTPLPSYTITKNGTPYIIAGHEPFSVNNVLDQKVLQISNNVNIFKGKHTFTIGSSFEKFQFDNSFNLTSYGFDLFGTIPLADFLTAAGDGSIAAAQAAAQATLNANNANNTWALAETNVGQFAFYAQDEIAISDKFNLTIGLRADVPLYFDTPTKAQETIDRKGGLLADGGVYDPTIVYYDENNSPISFDHTVLPDNKPLFSPRIGFNYDIDGDQTSQLRGGSGLFTGRLPFVWIGNQIANPDFFFYNVTHPDFKFPQVWRTNIGYDRKFENGLTLSGDIIYTSDINAMIVRNYGLRNPGGSLNGVDNRATYRSGSDRALVFGAPTNAYVFTNTDDGKSVNITIQAKKLWNNGVYSTLAYNFLDAKDASSIEAEISSDAYDRNPAFGNVNQSNLSPSLYGNKHRIVGTLNKKFSYKNDKMSTTVSMFFEYSQGGRFSYTYAGDINGDGGFNNDLVYVPTNTEIDAMAFAGTTTEQSTQRTAMKSFIAQDDYLSGKRGGYAEKYDILSPWQSNWDLRILQDFNINDNGNKIQFSIDILNVGNLISSKWGVKQIPTNIQPIGVSVFEEADGNLTPTYSFDTSVSSTFNDDFNLASRWRMQLGLRYIFK